LLCEGCRLPIEKAREDLGLTLCIICGDAQAQREIRNKSNQVGPSYNKGGYMFLGGASLRQNLLDAGRKTSAEVTDTVTKINFAATEVKAVAASIVRKKRRAIGLYWTANNDCFTWWEGDDPKKLGAVRQARL